MSAVLRRNAGGGGSPDPNTVLASGTLTLGALLKGVGSKNAAAASVTELAVTGALSDISDLDAFIADLVERVDPQEMIALPDINFDDIEFAAFSPSGDPGQQIGKLTIANVLQALRFARLSKLELVGSFATDPIYRIKYNEGGDDSFYDVHGFQYFTTDENIAASYLLEILPGQTLTIEGDITAVRIGGTATVEKYATCPFGIGHFHRKLDGTLMTDNGIYFYKNPTASNLVFGAGQYSGNFVYFGIAGLVDHDFVWDFNIRTFKASSLVV